MSTSPFDRLCSRRAFVVAASGLLASAALPRTTWARDRGPGVIPEYAGSLDEVLFVYDQCASPHLLRQMVEILRSCPPRVRVHAVVSTARAEEARARLSSFGFDDAHWIVTDEPGLSGSWPRDILQVGVGADGGRVAHVPWSKSARTREELDRTWRALSGLEREDLRVALLPIAGEGGNMVFDRTRDGNVLFAGSTIAVETRALTLAYWGFDPGDDGVAQVLAEAFGLDAVHWVGPRRDGVCARQSTYVFHVDMLLTLVGPGEAVVARCDPGRLGPAEHRDRLEREAARTVEALERREAMGMDWPGGLDLPRDAGERAMFLDERVREERALLAAAAHEMDAAAVQLEDLGYRVHRIDADPRRVRRYQSATNVVVAGDRLLVPLFPTDERVHGWVLHHAGQRDAVDVDLGPRDSDFDLSGDNLERVEFYRAFRPQVRAVRDYFYLASGNVHCVLGRLN